MFNFGFFGPLYCGDHNILSQDKPDCVELVKMHQNLPLPFPSLDLAFLRSSLVACKAVEAFSLLLICLYIH